jgi:ABC-type nitrate/sulfonate/bicarbonate transport system substrate-binding protein
MRNHAIGLMLAASALLPAPAMAQEEEASLAYPNVAFTFAAAYVAEDAGLFTKHGLKLKPLVVAGPGSTNSVVSGSADFALASTVVQTRAARAGSGSFDRQSRTGRSCDHPAQGLVRMSIPRHRSPTASSPARPTIAVDAIGSIIHGYPLMLAKRAGLIRTRRIRRWRATARSRRCRPARSTVCDVDAAPIGPVPRATLP